MGNVSIIDESYLHEIYDIEIKAQQDPWSIKLLKDCFESNYTILGYISEDGILQGYLIFTRVLDESELQNIAVEPTMQNHQIGSKLLNEYLKICLNDGIVQSFLEVRISNKRAIHLYEKFGYVQCGVRKNYYPTSIGREDAILMEFRKNAL